MLLVLAVKLLGANSQLESETHRGFTLFSPSYLCDIAAKDAAIETS